MSVYGISFHVVDISGVLLIICAGLPLIESGLVAGVGDDSDGCSAAPSHDRPLVLVEWFLATSYLI